VAGIVALLAACSPTVSKPPVVGHVFTLVLENESFDRSFGPGSRAPYLANTLARQGALLTQYYGIGHNSLDNYIAMISGQAPNASTEADCGTYTNFTPATPAADGQVTGNGCVYPASVSTVANQLTAAGLRWK